MTPILLQRGPEFLKYLDELLIVVFMIAGALLPAIKQAREKKKAADRLKEGLDSDAKPTPPTAGTARHADLEQRVRDYFEERSPAAARPKKAAVPPPPPTRRSPAPPTAHIAADFKDVHIDLKELSHLKSVTRPRMLAQSETRVARPLGGSRSSRQIRDLRRVLRDQQSIRQAILLKEILGPPKGMP